MKIKGGLRSRSKEFKTIYFGTLCLRFSLRMQFKELEVAEKFKSGLVSKLKDRKRSVEKVSRRVLRIKSELALLELSRDKTITCM
jgi:hypothetical protein